MGIRTNEVLNAQKEADADLMLDQVERSPRTASSSAKNLLRDIRTLDEIRAAEGEMSDRVWYDRHQMLVIEAAENGMCPDCAGLGAGEEAARRMEEKYGLEDLEPCCDLCAGVMYGKLSALRWVLGEDWDMLDT